MDVEKKYRSKSAKEKIKMKKFLKTILSISLISFFFFKTEKIQSIVPYYYLPAKKISKMGIFYERTFDFELETEW